MDKKTNAGVGYTEPMACNECVTQFASWMENSLSYRDGVLPVESRGAGRVPGHVTQKGPPQATGGHPVLMRGARLRRQRVNATGRKTLILVKPQDHSTFYSGMQRESSTKRFHSQNDFIKMLMWPASKRLT